MTEGSDISLSRALPETVLEPWPAEWVGELEKACGDATATPEERLAAVRAVARSHPSFLDAWATLAELSLAGGDDVGAYGFARVGYHRGLDALRAAGWRGSGYVRSSHRSNTGFLRSLEALGRAAAAIGEPEEEKRCRTFLRQLDPGRKAKPSR